MKTIDLLWFLTVVGLIYCEEGDVKRMVMAGSDVVLPCSLDNKDIGPALFDWMKDGRQDVFLYDAGTHYNNGRQGQDEQFKGRVSHFPDELINGNASIIIRNTRQSDSGSYTCYFPHIQQQRFHIELLVGVSPKPHVMILSITPDWALLQCKVRGAFPKPEIVWCDSDGIILPAEEKLEDSDDPHCPPTLTLQTNVTKTGNFRCVVTQQELHHVTEGHIHVPLGSENGKTISVGVIAGVCCLVLLSLVLAAAVIYWRWRFQCIKRCLRERCDGGMDSDLSHRLERCDGGMDSDLSHRLGRRDSGMDSDLENDPGRRDSGMDSDLENDPEQLLNTEEKTQPGVAPVEPDEAVTVHL